MEYNLPNVINKGTRDFGRKYYIQPLPIERIYGIGTTYIANEGNGTIQPFLPLPPGPNAGQFTPFYSPQELNLSNYNLTLYEVGAVVLNPSYAVDTSKKILVCGIGDIDVILYYIVNSVSLPYDMQGLLNSGLYQNILVYKTFYEPIRVTDINYTYQYPENPPLSQLSEEILGFQTYKYQPVITIITNVPYTVYVMSYYISLLQPRLGTPNI